MATACAQHFSMHMQVNELQVLKRFAEICQKSSLHGKYDGSKSYIQSSGNKRDRNGPSSIDPPSAKKKRHLLIPENRKAVAKIHGDWMLVKVLKYNKRKHQYIVEDGDEVAKDNEKASVEQDEIIVLPTEEELTHKKPFAKNARVLACFPKTSSFYLATVAKKCEKKSFEYSLRFDGDDEASNGDIRILKVPACEVVEAPYC